MPISKPKLEEIGKQSKKNFENFSSYNQNPKRTSVALKAKNNFKKKSSAGTSSTNQKMSPKLSSFNNSSNQSDTDTENLRLKSINVNKEVRGSTSKLLKKRETSSSESKDDNLFKHQSEQFQ